MSLDMNYDYKEYNKKCNKYFKYNLLDKYIVNFYNKNNINFITLKINNIKEIWVKYKILCVYDINNNYVLDKNDMIIIEKNIIDNNIIINKKKINKMEDIDIQIHDQIFNYDNIGYIKSMYKNKCYYYLIKEIIKI